MPTPSSWRELLQDIVRDTAERDRITAALKVSAITLRRWISGESNPRPRMFRLLQEAIPQPQRESFIRLAQKEFGNLAFQGNDEIVEKHCPAGKKAEVRIQATADVGVRGTRRRVQRRHPAIADGSNQHGQHGDQNGGRGVAFRQLLRDPEQRNGSDGCYTDDAKENQIPGG